MPKERFCLRCGATEEEVDFRSPLAMKCVECDEMTEEERRDYHRIYHKARGIATKALIAQYPDDYAKLLLRARRKVERQEKAKRASAA